MMTLLRIGREADMRLPGACAFVLWALLAKMAWSAGPAGQVVAQHGAVAAIREGVARALHIGAEVAAADRDRVPRRFDARGRPAE
jgi:uncharacterized membrane protein